MKITILGTQQAGQQQLFSLLTGITMESIQERPMEVRQGICEVRDPRVVRLMEMYKPKKTTFARIEYVLLPDFNPAQLRNADELCWITRFEDAARDTAAFISELIIHDLMLVEKRIQTIEKDKKGKFADMKEKEKQLMALCKAALDEEKLLQKVTFNEEQVKILRAYQFLTLKPLILVVNVPEDKIKDQAIAKDLADKFSVGCVSLSVELEQEIGSLSEEDRLAFMQEMGIEEPAIDRMTRLAFAALGLISFFTVGEDEVRAWSISKGALAPEAGAAIHTDIAKGFVRAEMFKYTDLLAAGSEAKLKELGKFYLKGRDYAVEDGDILSFRFNV